MILYISQLFLVQAGGVQSFVDVTIKGQDRLFGLRLGMFGGPVGVARHIKHGQLVAERHQFGNLSRRLLAQDLDQRLGLRDEAWFGVWHILGHGVEIQRFGGR